MKLKSWTETIHVFAQVVLRSFSGGPFYVVINGPGGPFMLPYSKNIGDKNFGEL